MLNIIAYHFTPEIRAEIIAKTLKITPYLEYQLETLKTLLADLAKKDEPNYKHLSLTSLKAMAIGKVLNNLKGYGLNSERLNSLSDTELVYFIRDSVSKVNSFFIYTQDIKPEDAEAHRLLFSRFERVLNNTGIDYISSLDTLKKEILDSEKNISSLPMETICDSFKRVNDYKAKLDAGLSEKIKADVEHLIGNKNIAALHELIATMPESNTRMKLAGKISNLINETENNK